MDSTSDMERSSENESDSDDSPEEVEEERRNAHNPFYPDIPGELTLGVGMPGFWYNGRSYLWTERNLK